MKGNCLKCLVINFGRLPVQMSFFVSASIHYVGPVVEQVDNSASLYASSIQGHHLCVLVKQLPDHSVSVDGKSTDFSLVSSVLEEMKSLLLTPP
ncbi:AP-3 complex subunit delta-1-like [Orbicella faveolata]|uniref:AP-3 complex subunit delta-1-like n=1 Tax=Orbicella faveolata TaxID=48498 RepID=UPI0009E54EA6|nr:AP-3 complex subunit delta-1-like [Orbicella faveolata]